MVEDILRRVSITWQKKSIAVMMAMPFVVATIRQHKTIRHHKALRQH